MTAAGTHRQTGSQAAAPSVTPGAATRVDTRIDTREMLVVHTALLRELRLAPGAVRRVAAGDRAQARAVAGHLGLVLDVLHHHHTGEDELLWPLLRPRAGDAVALLEESMRADHALVDDDVREVRAAVRAWEPAADPAAGQVVAGHLGRLHAHLEAHLDAEERQVLPIVPDHLDVEEWARLGEAGMAATPRRQLPLVLGMLMYEADPEVIRGMLAPAPALPRALMPRLAPRAYARRARRVYGTPAP